mmetsp:Transcript_2550/g.3864  ORF Transcript_2550/g.3864 Transcript_2550/m.3864 type:complete len:187 (+) Transcript_2550:197-757(+)
MYINRSTFSKRFTTNGNNNISNATNGFSHLFHHPRPRRHQWGFFAIWIRSVYLQVRREIEILEFPKRKRLGIPWEIANRDLQFPASIAPAKGIDLRRGKERRTWREFPKEFRTGWGNFRNSSGSAGGPPRAGNSGKLQREFPPGCIGHGQRSVHPKSAGHFVRQEAPTAQWPRATHMVATFWQIGQ